MKTITIVAPAWWASYLVNGDASGLSTDEKAQADAWLRREEVRVIGTTEDEAFFTNHARMYVPEAGYSAGDMLTYIARVVE